jgi:hypothetical protein
MVLCLAVTIAGVAHADTTSTTDPGTVIGGVIDPPTRSCNGTPGQWSGCRGNGCAVCAELVELYPLYFPNHPECSPNYTCAGQYYTCNEACPAPTSADLCNGTPGQWSGCRGNGCAVCAELVADYPLYFINHPLCSPNYTCGGLHFTCNENCPKPTIDDMCDAVPGDVNLNGLICDVGDAVLLENFLACQDDLTPEQIANSDLNGDCMVDQADSDYMLDCVGGGPAPLPCACATVDVTGCRCSQPGDVNLNGLICEIGDVVALENFLACQSSFTPEQITNSDVNADCIVDQADSAYLLDCLSGGPEPMACVCGEPDVTDCRCSSPGDVNLNGLVGEIGDVVLLENFLACQANLTAEQIRNSDVNGDCMVDQNDSAYLLDYIGGGPAPEACVCENPQVTNCRCSSPGDTNGNGIVADIGDVIYLGNFLCSGGPPPDPLVNGNVDGDCDIDLTDYNVLLDIVTNGGDPAPCTCSDPVVLGCE